MSSAERRIPSGKSGQGLETAVSRITPEFGYWFAGLVDGEGCFFIGAGGCSFHINLRADDGPMLEAIREELGFGRIYYNNLDGDGTARNPACQFSATRYQQCLALTSVFDEFPLRSKKARDYAIWREAVVGHRLWAKDALASVEYYRREMAEARKYRKPEGVEVYVPREFPVQPSLLDEVLP